MPGVLQSSFSRGEISPELHGRVDLTFYQTAVKTAKNVFVRKSGGLSNRAGTRFVAECKFNDRLARLVSFQYSTTQPYILEMGDFYMRIIRYGGQVVYPVGHASAGQMVEIPTPYLAADLRKLAFTQSADEITVTARTYSPIEIARLDHHDWTISEAVFEPVQTAPASLTAEITLEAGASTETEHVYAVTAVSAETSEESLPIVSVTLDGPAVLDATNHVDLTWPTTSGANRYNVYKYRNGLYGLIGSSEDLAFADDGITPDVGDNPPSARNPFNGSDNWPACSAYWEQRIWYAGSEAKPDTFEASKISAFSNFSTSAAVKDDDAITGRTLGQEVNAIRHMIPYLGTLLLMTSGTAQRINRADNGVTPALQGGVRAQYKKPIADLAPLFVGDLVLFYSQTGDTPDSAPTHISRQKPHGTVEEITLEGIADRFDTTERSILSSHFVENNAIVAWAYAQKPFSILWMVRDDGKLLSLTHMKEHEVYGWCLHDTDGFFEDVAVVPEGDESAVYLIVRRRIDGVQKRFIERMASRRFEEAQDGFFLDCGLSYDVPVTISGVSRGKLKTFIEVASGHDFSAGDEIDLTEIVGTTELNNNRFKVISVMSNTIEIASVRGSAPGFLDSDKYGVYEGGGVARKVVSSISGADHLAGEAVTVVVDGKVAGKATWLAGLNAIPNGRKGSRVHVGLRYVSDIETLPIVAEPDIYTKKKGVNRVNIWAQKSAGFQVGPSFDDLDQIQARRDENYSQAARLRSGLEQYTHKKKLSIAGNVCIRQDEPLPMEISTIIPEIQIDP